MTDFVLVIGNGAREHALAWKLSQSPVIKHVYVSPGNAGTDTNGSITNCDVNVKSHADVAQWCKSNNVKLVVVGPEAYLADGLADYLANAGIKCFGPCQKAAEIEASKEFAKAFMDRCNIPTARWKSFTSAEEAQEHISSASYDALVVKASGLAAGKGVIVGKNKEEAIQAVKTLKQDKALSSASDIIVIEELLTGEEVSVLCFSDGNSIAVMPPAQDHKRLLNNDEGPNTGGMGAYCRCPLVSDADMEFIKENVLQRAIDGMKTQGSPYIGVLYAGLMLTKDGPKVLEYNCRFGDPETQVILPLLETDLYNVMLASVNGKLNNFALEWSKTKHAVGVVVVSGGYPESYPKGKSITGIEKVSKDSVVFHAGTSKSAGNLVTSGGRVLTVVSIADSLKDAAAEAQLNASYINFEGAFYRTDIAAKGLQKSQPKGMTYKSSGVDIESADDLVKKISTLCKQTLRKEVCGGIGGFGGVFELSGYDKPYLVSKIGNVGELLKIAQDCNSYQVIGENLVANSVNEILCHGAEPLFFLDTFTCGKLDVEVAAKVITGITKGCKEANCALIGGETAEMPGMYFETDFDLTSFARGAVEKSNLLPRRKDISKGDIAIGLLSSTLNLPAIQTLKQIIRRQNLTYNTPAPFDNSKTLGEVMLAPRDIYVQSVLPLMRKGTVKAATYINDKGVMKSLNEVLPEGYDLELNPANWKLPPVFEWIAQNAQLAQKELFRDYNCGIDMILVVGSNVAEEVLGVIGQSGKTAVVVGKIVEDTKNQELSEIKSTSLFPKKKVAVLTSVKGTCLEALLNYAQSPLSSSEISVVVSFDVNVEIPKNTLIPVKVLNAKDFETNETRDKALNEILKSHNVEIICLDGLSKEFSSEFLGAWNGNILYVHPSILPAFDCSNPLKEALDFGARITGCTVSLIQDANGKDKIIEQAAIDVGADETLPSLGTKLSNLQDLTYIKALENFASGKYVTDAQPNDLQLAYTSSRLSQFESNKLNKYLQELMKKTDNTAGVTFVDSSCGLYDLEASRYTNPLLISGTDGVGTKLKIAQACNRHDTIGIDLVAMCVNDIMTHGAQPLFFLSCFDCAQIDPVLVKKVMSGVAKGCELAQCALVGAEINEIPDIYANPKQCMKDLCKYDVVGYSEGAVFKENLLPKSNTIKSGDLVIGVSSSGVHSNGYSLVRKIVNAKNHRYTDKFPLGESQRTLGEELLVPTKIYVRSVLPLIKNGFVKAAAHITGGGLTQNIPRVLPKDLKVVLDGNSWEIPPILKWLAAEGNLSNEEMLQTFNCGLGMVLIVDKKHKKDVLEHVRQKNEKASVVGLVSQFNKGEEQVEVNNFNISQSCETKPKKKVGVLISGSGTNLQSLINYTQDPNNCSSAEIVLVVSNVEGVEGLNRAKRAGIPTEVISHKNYKKRVEFDMAVNELLKERGVEIVCLAGFMRIVSKEFVQLWQGKLLNVHPALLPSFKGMNAHKQVLEAGAKITGCSVHFVEAEVDAGAVIEQAAVFVDPTDTENSLQEKVKVLEHKIFPTALELVASGRVSRGTDSKLVWNH